MGEGETDAETRGHGDAESYDRESGRMGEGEEPEGESGRMGEGETDAETRGHGDEEEADFPKEDI
jgi:hypothetical protein